MQKLLSLPPNLVEAFPELEHVNTDEWFCTSGCSLISYSFGLSFDTFADGYENILPQTFHACGNSFCDMALYVCRIAWIMG